MLEYLRTHDIDVNQMAYKRKAGTKKFAKRARPYKKGRRNVGITALIRRTVLRVAEPKTKDYSPAKVELYHNSFYTVGGIAPNGFVTCMNTSAAMPQSGSLDNCRIGDQVNLSHFDIKLLIGQKADRPNVTFRYMVLGVPKGSSIDYASWFTAVTNNVLLDDPNTDFVRIYKRGFWRPNEAGLLATGNDEYTFTKRLRVPYKKVVKFGPSNGSTTHNDQDLYFVLMCYDAYGSLGTDNVAYVQMSQCLHYRDP